MCTCSRSICYPDTFSASSCPLHRSQVNWTCVRFRVRQTRSLILIFIYVSCMLYSSLGPLGYWLHHLWSDSLIICMLCAHGSELRHHWKEDFLLCLILDSLFFSIILSQNLTFSFYRIPNPKPFKITELGSYFESMWTCV